MKLLLLGGWHVLLGRCYSFSKEILLHLLDDDFLIFAPRRIQPILIQQHLAEFCPRVPRLQRDVLVDFLAQLGIKRRLVQAGEIFLEFDAENFSFCHEVPRSRCERKLSHRQRNASRGQNFGPIKVGPELFLTHPALSLWRRSASCRCGIARRSRSIRGNGPRSCRISRGHRPWRRRRSWSCALRGAASRRAAWSGFRCRTRRSLRRGSARRRCGSTRCWRGSTRRWRCGTRSRSYRAARRSLCALRIHLWSLSCI